MKQYQITFKRVEAFYQTIIIETETQEEARVKADQLSFEGEIGFDYFKESDVLEEYIIDIECI